MIDIISEYKGKLICLYLRGNTSPFAGIVDKVYEKIFILKCNVVKDIYININDISAILKNHNNLSYSFGTFDEHVVPNAFT